MIKDSNVWLQIKPMNQMQENLDSLFKLSRQECGSSFKNMNIQIPKLKKNYIFYKLTISILFSLSFKRLR